MLELPPSIGLSEAAKALLGAAQREDFFSEDPISQMISDLNYCRNDLAELEKYCSDLAAQNMSLSHDVKIIKSQLENAQKEAESLKQTISDMRESGRRLKDEKANLESQLSKSQTDYNQLVKSKSKIEISSLAKDMKLEEFYQFLLNFCLEDDRGFISSSTAAKLITIELSTPYNMIRVSMRRNSEKNFDLIAQKFVLDNGQWKVVSHQSGKEIE